MNQLIRVSPRDLFCLMLMLPGCITPELSDHLPALPDNNANSAGLSDTIPFDFILLYPELITPISSINILRESDKGYTTFASDIYYDQYAAIPIPMNDYTDLMRAVNDDGKVILFTRLLIDDDGSVSSANVINSTSTIVDSIVIEIALLLKYRPAIDESGNAIRSIFTQPISLRLRD